MREPADFSQEELEHVEDSSSGTRPAWFGDRSRTESRGKEGSPAGIEGLPRERERETVKEGHGRREKKRDKERERRGNRKGRRSGRAERNAEKARRKEEKKGGR